MPLLERKAEDIDLNRFKIKGGAKDAFMDYEKIEERFGEIQEQLFPLWTIQ